jgi:hypothetical protein
MFKFTFSFTASLLMLLAAPILLFASTISWIGGGWNFGTSSSTYQISAVNNALKGGTVQDQAGYGGAEFTIQHYGDHLYVRVELGGLADVTTSILSDNSNLYPYMDCYLAGAKLGGEFIQFGDAGGIGAGGTFGWRVFGADPVKNALQHTDGTKEDLVPVGTGVFELGPHLETSYFILPRFQALSTLSWDFWLMKDGLKSSGFSWTTYLTYDFGPIALALRPNYQFKSIQAYEFKWGTSSNTDMKAMTSTWSIGLIVAISFQGKMFNVD